MIRKVFWLLLLANLAFFSFLYWGDALLKGGAGLQTLPPLNADKIRLLGFSAANLPATIASAPVAVSAPAAILPTQHSAPASAPAAAPAPLACLEWGEFSGTDLTHASANLAELKLGDRLSQREVEHTIGYWVYIPPLKSRAEVNKKVKQLKKYGIDDYFVVQEKGKWQNTISLGVFKTEEIAQRFLMKLKSKGIKSAIMGERQTRLKFTVFLLKNPDADALVKLVEWQKNFTDIGMKATPCD